MLRLRSVLALILLAACSPQLEETTHSFRIYEEKGVEIAETKGGPEHSENLFNWILRLEIRPTVDNPDALLVDPRGFTRDRSGFYYLVDYGAAKVVVFNSFGEFEGLIGRPGEGPGEFNRPRFQGIDVSKIEIFDDILKRTAIYDLSRTLLEVVTIREPRSRMLGLFVAPNDNLITIRRTSEEDGYYGWNRQIADILSSDQKLVISLETPKVAVSRVMLRFEDVPNSWVRSYIHFAGQPLIKFYPDKGILMSTGETPSLKWFDSEGSLFQEIRIECVRQYVSKKERKEAQRIAANIDRRSTELGISGRTSFVELVELRDPKAYWTNVGIDEAGYYWLEYPQMPNQQEEPNGPTHRVLSPEGEYLGDVAFPHYGGIVAHGEYLVIVTDEDTWEKIPKVYTIENAVQGFDYP